MKTFVSVVGSCLVLSLCLLPGFGQTAPSAAPLSWSECVSLALHNNPAIASSLHAVAASRSSYSGSYNGILPQIDLSHGYSNANNGNTSNWETRGAVSLNLFDKSQYATIQASRAALQQATAANRETSALLRLNLSKAFYQVIIAQKNIEVSKNIVNMRQQEAQLVTLRYNSGTEYKGNMLRAKAQLLQAQTELSQAQRDLRTAQRVLDQQLGYDDFITINVTGTLDAPDPGDLPGNEQLLVDRRPDVMVQQAIIESANASLNQASSTLWPTLAANYSLSNTGPDEFGTLQSGWGVALNYPLFGGGPTASYFARKTAHENLQKVQQDLRAVRQQATVDIESAWSNLKGSIDQSTVAATLLEAARTRNDEANIRYNSGLMTYDNWEIIASDRINQERQVIQSQLNALNAEAQWANALGKQLELP
jgi:outer membrane protein TolC